MKRTSSIYRIAATGTDQQSPVQPLRLATKAHELTHWTSLEKGLNRDFSAKRFGDAGYAQEELVTEPGSALLCAALGITPEVREDHSAYLGHWLKVLKEDKRAIFSAAAHAQRAADCLHGLQVRPA